jgi:hypothetical protein
MLYIAKKMRHRRLAVMLFLYIIDERLNVEVSGAIIRVAVKNRTTGLQISFDIASCLCSGVVTPR